MILKWIQDTYKKEVITYCGGRMPDIYDHIWLEHDIHEARKMIDNRNYRPKNLFPEFEADSWQSMREDENHLMEQAYAEFREKGIQPDPELHEP